VIDSKLIDVFVISTPGSDRVTPLLEVLEKSHIFKTHIINAIMYSAQSDKREVDRVGQRAIYGHELPDGAIGCAISHQNAYQLIVKLGKGAIILEDDARIPNLENFEKMVSCFSFKSPSGPAILSLLPWNHKEPCSGKEIAPKQFFKLIGKTPLTVGYLLNLDAAVELSHANPRLKYTADWPPSRVTYFSSLVGVISHGDQQSGSTIQHVNRDSAKIRISRLLHVLFLDFWRYRNEFNSVADYFILKIAPSLTWRIDNFRGRLGFHKLNI